MPNVKFDDLPGRECNLEVVNDVRTKVNAVCMERGFQEGEIHVSVLT